MIWTLQQLAKSISHCSKEIEIEGKKYWVPARPVVKGEPIPRRLKAAWLVLIGRADALIWPEGQ